MAEILLMNPKSRGKRKVAKKRGRASTAHLVKYQFKTGAKRERKKNPAPRVATSRRKHRRRNPVSLRGIGRSAGKLGITPLLLHGLQAAGGGLAVDVLYGYVPIPETLRAGILGQGVRVGASLAIGILAMRMIKGPAGQHIAVGATSAALRDVIKGALSHYAPGLKLGDDGSLDSYMGYYSPAPLAGYQLNGYQLGDTYTNGGTAFAGGDLTAEQFDPTMNMGYQGDVTNETYEFT